MEEESCIMNFYENAIMKNLTLDRNAYQNLSSSVFNCERYIYRERERIRLNIKRNNALEGCIKEQYLTKFLDHILFINLFEEKGKVLPATILKSKTQQIVEKSCAINS